MKDHTISMVSGLAGVIIGAILQFAITYHLVEKPKIAIEEKKTAIEVQKIISSLSANIETECSSEKGDNWTWHINCQAINKGTFPVNVRIKDASIYLVSDQKRVPLKQGQNFSISFPKENYKPILNAGSRGYLDYYIILNKQDYPDGVKQASTGANTVFEFETSPAAQRFLIKNFPDAAAFIEEYSKSGVNFMTLLTDSKDSSSGNG
ncbi:hypothetical protein [Pseudomonas sp. Marseille-Q5117]|uniref:hypothetical protein n=1 Tax=Pseudomonas sp. Marseille-Q5117 TaxID=2972777 RepID=UPI0021C88712|nr:hypothetical protein [Pseudomonas sp. Marseille-Q5117]